MPRLSQTAVAATPRVEGEAARVMAGMGRREILPVLLATFALYAAFIGPASFSLAVRIAQIDLDARDAALPLAIGVPGVLALIVNPAIAVVSDSSRSRFGRRKPAILIGSLVSAAGVIVVAMATSISGIIIGWSIAYLGYSLQTSMLSAHLGDRLHESQRGIVMGILGAVTMVAPIFGFGLAASLSDQPVAMFLVPGGLALVAVLGIFRRLDDAAVRHSSVSLNLSVLIRGYYFNPRQHPALAWLWLSRFFVFLSLSFMSLYTIYMLSARLDMTSKQVGGFTATLGLGGALLGIVGSLGSGWRARGPRMRTHALAISALTLSLALAAIAGLTTTRQYVGASLLSSLAIGVYGAIGQAMALDVIPQDGLETGRYLSILGLGSAIPQAFGPFLASLILRFTDDAYASVYAVASALALLGSLAALRTASSQRHRNRPLQPSAPGADPSQVSLASSEFGHEIKESL